MHVADGRFFAVQNGACAPSAAGAGPQNGGPPMGLPVVYCVPDEATLARMYPPPPRRPSERTASGRSLSMRSGSRRAAPVREEEEKKPRHFPLFCLVVIAANMGVFVLEIYTNGWSFQPFSCPATCAGGMPCYEDGTLCQANPLLGPTVAVLDGLGAKNDVAIFEHGEWWRIAACNWLHAGVIHLVLNLAAIWAVGGELERTFGLWRVGFLYIFSGLFGTCASIVFLPGTLSVGASASVFGLVGANWADVVVNFCARCTLKNSGIICLTVATVLNVSIGFTPYVDNFMHLG